MNDEILETGEVPNDKDYDDGSAVARCCEHRSNGIQLDGVLTDVRSVWQNIKSQNSKFFDQHFINSGGTSFTNTIKMKDICEKIFFELRFFDTAYFNFIKPIKKVDAFKAEMNVMIMGHGIPNALPCFDGNLDYY